MFSEAATVGSPEAVVQRALVAREHFRGLPNGYSQRRHALGDRTPGAQETGPQRLKEVVGHNLGRRVLTLEDFERIEVSVVQRAYRLVEEPAKVPHVHERSVVAEGRAPHGGVHPIGVPVSLRGRSEIAAQAVRGFETRADADLKHGGK